MTINSITKDYQHWMSQSWLKRLAVTAICVALAYGFASWAIDSGSLLLYALTIVLVYLAAGSLIKATRQVLSRNDR